MVSLEEAIKSYGEIFYQLRENAPNQIYIVSQVHIGPDGSLPQIIPKIQMEVLRIGQELVRNHNVSLILPESRYTGIDYFALDLPHKRNLPVSLLNWYKNVNDDELIEYFRKTLHEGINSGSLLGLEANTVVQGFEVEEIHKAVLSLTLNIESKLLFDYLNGLRELHLLLNTPKVALREKKLGRIPNLHVLVTFGDLHINKLIESIEQDRFHLNGISNKDFPTINMALDYAKSGYGVTVIRPESM